MHRAVFFLLPQAHYRIPSDIYQIVFPGLPGFPTTQTTQTGLAWESGELLICENFGIFFLGDSLRKEINIL